MPFAMLLNKQTRGPNTFYTNNLNFLIVVRHIDDIAQWQKPHTTLTFYDAVYNISIHTKSHSKRNRNDVVSRFLFAETQRSI